MKRLALAALAALAAFSGPLRADDKPVQVPLADFIRHPNFLDVKISPTGEYFAASIMATEDTGALVILRRSDQKMVGTMKLRGRTFVQGFEWVNNERVLLAVAERDGSVSPPRGTGELYATNFDGSKQQLLIGGRQETKLTANIGRASHFVGARLIDDLRDDDKHVLFEVYGLSN
jgi:hypothetical protein